MITTLSERLRGLASLFWREVAKFGAVGGVAFIIDNGLTYYLMHGPMTDSEAKARFVGASVATVFSWLANRFWTFRHRRQDNVLREFVMFILINGIGIGISTGFTALAKYGFGVTDKNMLFPPGWSASWSPPWCASLPTASWSSTRNSTKSRSSRTTTRSSNGTRTPARRPAAVPDRQGSGAARPAGLAGTDGSRRLRLSCR